MAFDLNGQNRDNEKGEKWGGKFQTKLVTFIFAFFASCFVRTGATDWAESNLERKRKDVENGNPVTGFTCLEEQNTKAGPVELDSEPLNRRCFHTVLDISRT